MVRLDIIYLKKLGAAKCVSNICKKTNLTPFGFTESKISLRRYH